MLRLTIEFADGRSVTNLDPPFFRSDELDLDYPMLSEARGPVGEADGRIWDLDYRVRPCPRWAAGFVCEWPGRGIQPRGLR